MPERATKEKNLTLYTAFGGCLLYTSFMTVAGILVGALILLAAGLVIYNILKISVSKRIKGYGTPVSYTHLDVYKRQVYEV